MEESEHLATQMSGGRQSDRFSVGDRVGVKDTSPPLYGTIIRICQCFPYDEFPDTYEYACVTVDLHESCGNVPYVAKYYQLEKVD